MNSMDSSNYFLDPRVASFVDDVQRGDTARVKAGLAAGISPNEQGIKGARPIHFVFFANDAAVLKLLLASGADPNSPLADGNTPLHFAVRHQNTDFTRLLLAAGADPNGRGANEKPHIHEALFQIKGAEQVKLLATGGADINVAWGGGTPVMNALEIGDWEVAQTLIDLGSDMTPKNHFGKNALDLACKSIRDVPANDANRKGISSIVLALKRRDLALPCKADLDKFR